MAVQAEQVSEELAQVAFCWAGDSPYWRRSTSTPSKTNTTEPNPQKQSRWAPAKASRAQKTRRRSPSAS